MLEEFQIEPKVQFIHVIIISSGENVIQRLYWTENPTPL